MNRRLFLTALAVAMVLLPAATAVADHHETESDPMVWLRYYKVKPGMSGQFVEEMHKFGDATLDGLVDDGSLAGWGMTVPFTITGSDWTHMLWIAGTGWGDFDKLMAAMAEPNPDDVAAFEATIDSRWDRVLRHIAFLPGSTDPGYLRISYYKANPGMNDAMLGLFNDIGRPVYSELQADGTVGAAGMSMQKVVLDPSWSHLVWVFTPNLAGLETAGQAVQARFGAMAAEEGAALGERITEAMDQSAYHQEIQRVIHAKAPAE